ncbi:uncharacterized protein E0L32_007961 [Thyridium curvatum]|uniref:BTB domain-containing protein n=1 Tax=Thyridium curvatum TaxID=1093900 RepID=A0A507B3D6_9PEZI|nr:uncharacterized protein E0L32_007961 [Thyridium curvatum]TPX11100.1 hypothetical protein E0L32_007961 [Thyridium curvatum]
MNHQKLKHHVRNMRNTLYSEPLDLACTSYAKIQEECASLVRALLTPPTEPREVDAPSRFSGAFSRGKPGEDAKASQQYIADVQAWRKCLEDLAAILRTRLERTGLLGASEGTGENQPSRSDRQMSNERHTHYKRIQQDLDEIDRLLEPASTGIAPEVSQERTTIDYVIARRGDAILQFENAALENAPILRFRVSSHMLRETSPIFARMFFVKAEDLDLDHLDMEEDVSSELPPKPNKFTCPDGSTAMLYRMPQLELNKDSMLKLLLYAAHMQSEKIPRSLSFKQLVSLAETCLRYRCTTPVEFPFEHLWLNQWIHYAAGPEADAVVPHGMLLISYAFGLRRLFTRTSKTAILFLRGDEDIEAQSSWPPELKKRIAAMCETKRAQIYEACAAAVQEYLPRAAPPKEPETAPRGNDPEDETASTEPPNAEQCHPAAAIHTISLSSDSTTRCPAGNIACDAANLGWLVIGLSQRGLLPRPPFSPYQQQPSNTGSHEPPPLHPPGRSVSDLIDALRSIPSPPQAAHPVAAACDPTRALRDFANDVYNSVSGLTLFQASGGRAHGWALSRRKRDEPQRVLSVLAGGSRRTAPSYTAAGEEAVSLQGGEVDDQQVVDEMRAMRIDKSGHAHDDDDDDEDEDWTMTDGQGSKDEQQKQDVVGAVTMMMQSATLREEVTSDEEGGTAGRMTQEEAYKILWPETTHDEQVVASPPPTAASDDPPPFPKDGETDAAREKFLAHDTVLHISEAKMLVSVDGKQLRGERDEMVGLIPPREAGAA